MKRYAKGGLILALALLGAGCSDFLTGPGLTEDPNNPTQASATQLFVAMQVRQFLFFESQIARQATIYTQQMIGSNNQQLSYATQYGVVEGDISNQFNGMYIGGGLADMRKIEAAAKTAGDAQMEGITKIWEALVIGMGASVWGDLPYSEAVTADIKTPKLDAQQDIYAAVQALLDDAISILSKVSAPGATRAEDFVFNGNTTRWIAAANTIKARFYLHLAERNGTSAYTAALAAAQKGISEAPTAGTNAMHNQGAGDLRTFHGTTLDVDGNGWGEFLTSRKDLVAGAFMIQLLKSRNDPRLAAYFDKNSSGDYIGWDQNAKPVGTGAASVLNTPVRQALNFRQPIVTWEENQLIMAEAKFKTGDAAGALTNVNNVRTAVGMPALAGPITLTDIMTEKYIAQFQNIDVWNDYKRTCVPAVTPFSTATEVPGRLPYGSAERTNNPNLPLPSAQPARNWNDPTACPKP